MIVAIDPSEHPYIAGGTVDGGGGLVPLIATVGMGYLGAIAVFGGCIFYACATRHKVLSVTRNAPNVYTVVHGDKVHQYDYIARHAFVGKALVASGLICWGLTMLISWIAFYD